jgi:GT2 family glycosyltransferase
MTPPTSTTIAIPMHASRPFVDVISANISALPADVDIVVSDRTRVDDAIEWLRERHRDDPRVRFVASSDGLGIIDHYNALLREARGEYFMWMPHDDTFPPEYVPLLRAALDANPGANLAFGRVHPIDLDGAVADDMVRFYVDPPITLGTRARAAEAIYLWHHWSIWIPYRGLMRRREVVRRRLFLRRGLQEYGHDNTWVFAMTVVAPLVYVPECVCEKRYHPASHHVETHRRRGVDDLWEVVTVGRYVVTARIPLRDAASAMKYTTALAVLRASRRLPEGVRESFPNVVRHLARTRLVP